MHTLKNPEEYLPHLQKLRASNPHAKKWCLRIDRMTNRHPETDGGPWGWYEIWPIGIEVGFWGTNRDDLKGVDRHEWNRRAEMISLNVEQKIALPTFGVGDRVIKTDGDYTFEGTVVAVVHKLSGAIRYVVEDDRGILLIMFESKLKKV